jgi:hypothetical protein
LILIRNIVRVVEYAQGWDGWVVRHEFMLFIFDAVTMLALLVIVVVWDPAKLLDHHLQALARPG